MTQGLGRSSLPLNAYLPMQPIRGGRRTVAVVSDVTHLDIGESCDNGPCLHGSLLDFDEYGFRTAVGAFEYGLYAW